MVIATIAGLPFNDGLTKLVRIIEPILELPATFHEYVRSITLTELLGWYPACEFPLRNVLWSELWLVKSLIPNAELAILQLELVWYAPRDANVLELTLVWTVVSR